MKSARKFSLILLIALFAISLVACGGDAGASTELTVTVNATDIDGSPIVLGEVTFASENPTVLEALQAMCTAREVACEASDLGVVSKIGDVGTKNYTDKETGKNMAVAWGWRLNGTEGEDLGFANATTVKTGDTIEYYQYAMVVEEDAWFENAEKFEGEENNG